jgi:hypothetical protein
MDVDLLPKAGLQLGKGQWMITKVLFLWRNLSTIIALSLMDRPLHNNCFGT